MCKFLRIVNFKINNKDYKITNNKINNLLHARNDYNNKNKLDKYNLSAKIQIILVFRFINSKHYIIITVLNVR